VGRCFAFANGGRLPPRISIAVASYGGLMVGWVKTYVLYKGADPPLKISDFINVHRSYKWVTGGRFSRGG
jgi:hypothetical protein